MGSHKVLSCAYQHWPGDPRLGQARKVHTKEVVIKYIKQATKMAYENAKNAAAGLYPLTQAPWFEMYPTLPPLAAGAPAGAPAPAPA